MANLKSIKSKIQSYKKTGTVTHAMEAVSAVKMRKSQERALSGRSYAAAALSVLERLSRSADLSKHELMSTVEAPTCFVVITSDKGLAGSLNSGVIKKVEKEIAERHLDRGVVYIAPIGRRGRDYFTSRGYNILKVLPDQVLNVSDDVSIGDVYESTRRIMEARRDKIVGDVFVVYQNFASTFEQFPEMRQVLPITPEMMKEMVVGIRPVRGKYAPAETGEDARVAVYTVEPDADTVLATLLPRLLNIALFHTLLESKASEHSARMVAMKSATDKAKEMAQSLTRTFNKVRQAVITREVSEITSGIEAMR